MAPPEKKSQAIEVFARVRPNAGAKPLFTFDGSDNTITFTIPKTQIQGPNNAREVWQYQFEKIFGPEVQQDEIFTNIGYRAVERVMNGYNSTVFCYGQTGSGKTHTLTGPPAGSYDDRGLIPRCIQEVFGQIEANQTSMSYSVAISYLEVHNNKGYDLLSRERQEKLESTSCGRISLADLTKVQIFENEKGEVYLPLLSRIPASNVDEALDILLDGDMVRVVSATPMNQASSRSHCIFTVTVTAREDNSDKVRISKLNLVDLAGSERVHRTKIEGDLLLEAQNINVSLFLLERVISALADQQETGERYIPYRSSMMTHILKDSLGGNALTMMVATLHSDSRHVFESISSCSFAQRVAQVRNMARMNLQLDLPSVVARLKKENRRLKEELALLSGGERGPITASERARCAELVREYVDGQGTEDFWPGDGTKIRECFRVFRRLVLDGGPPVGPPPPSEDVGRIGSLEQLVLQRDREIEILVDLNKQLEQRIHSAALQSKSATPSEYTQDDPQSPYYRSPVKAASQSFSGSPREAARPPQPAMDGVSRSILSLDVDAAVEVLKDRERSYQFFREYYVGNAAAEENQQLLRSKIEQAKLLGAGIQQLKGQLEVLKGQINVGRQKRFQDGISDQLSEDQLSALDQQELELRNEISILKKRYSGEISDLRGLKADITGIQKTLETGKARLAAEFHTWHNAQVRKLQDYVKQKQGQAVVRDEVQAPAPAAAPQMQRSASKGLYLAAPVKLSPQQGQAVVGGGTVVAQTTGNSEVDAEVARFMATRQKLVAGRKAKK